jgi:hypothetical protein
MGLLLQHRLVFRRMRRVFHWSRHDGLVSMIHGGHVYKVYTMFIAEERP